MTDTIQWEAIKWPEDMAPIRSPSASPTSLKSASFLKRSGHFVDPKAWPSFYPGVEHVQLLDRHDSLRLGTRFETNLAGQDVFASVQEFKPMTRIAWGFIRKFPKNPRRITVGSLHPRRMDAISGLKRQCTVFTGSNWLKSSRCLLAHPPRSFLQISPRPRANAKAVVTKLLSPSGGLGLTTRQCARKSRKGCRGQLLVQARGKTWAPLIFQDLSKKGE